MSIRIVPLLIAVVITAVVFVSIGYAYTAVTENTDNTAYSEYVVLSQQDYDLTDKSVPYDIVTNVLGTSYELSSPGDSSSKGPVHLIDYYSGNVYASSVREYWGVMVGSDTLKAEKTGGDESALLPVSVETFFTESNGAITTGFMDYSSMFSGWRYIMKVQIDLSDEDYDSMYGGSTDKPPKVQYLMYDGKETATNSHIFWTVLEEGVGGQIGKWVDSKSNCILLAPGVKYKTELYLAGFGQEVDYGRYYKLDMQSTKLTGDTTMKAVWREVNTAGLICVTYIDDYPVKGHSFDIYTDPKSDLMLPDYPYPTMPAGKVFVGWKAEGTKIYAPGYMYKEHSKNITFQAQFVDESNGGYSTITFNYNGGTEDEHDPVKAYTVPEVNYTLPMCEATKVDAGKTYRFIGWSEKQIPGAGDPIYEPRVSYNMSITESKTFYAQWEEVETTMKKVELHGFMVDHPLVYTYYTDSKGNFTLPQNMMGPYFLYGTESTTWVFAGWEVIEGKELPGKKVAHSDMPICGTSNKIIDNGTIKFVYNSIYSQSSSEQSQSTDP